MRSSLYPYILKFSTEFSNYNIIITSFMVHTPLSYLKELKIQTDAMKNLTPYGHFVIDRINEHKLCLHCGESSNYFFICKDCLAIFCDHCREFTRAEKTVTEIWIGCPVCHQQTLVGIP